MGYSLLAGKEEGKSNKIESCEEQCTGKIVVRCKVQVQEESMKEYSEGGNDILKELSRLLQKERETFFHRGKKRPHCRNLINLGASGKSLQK